MQIKSQVSLTEFNTFGLAAIAECLVSFKSEEDLLIVLDSIDQEAFILGGGSNILLVNDRVPLVLKNEIEGIQIIQDNEDHVLVEVGAGVVWHQLVLWTLEQDLGGIENLALIPGNCGAAPIQNIGAYGVELKDVFHSLWCIQKEDKLQLSFHNNECEFAYRESIFKRKLKNKVIITKIVLKLTKPGHHKINSSYGAITSQLEAHGVNVNPSIQDIAKAVIEIRTKKLPDPKVIGNSGSFFKNPIVKQEVYDQLLKEYPNAPGYPATEGFVKLAAGWLIDQCGWKGKVVGQTGCYKNQALVLVNHGKATGQEILNFSKEVIKSVQEKFGVLLSPEVNIIK